MRDTGRVVSVIRSGEGALLSSFGGATAVPMCTAGHMDPVHLGTGSYTILMVRAVLVKVPAGCVSYRCLLEDSKQQLFSVVVVHWGTCAMLLLIPVEFDLQSHRHEIWIIIEGFPKTGAWTPTPLGRPTQPSA